MPRSILNSDLSLKFRQTTSSGKSIGSRSLVGVASPTSCRRRRSLQIALRGPINRGSGEVSDKGGGGRRRKEFWYPDAFVESKWFRIDDPSKGRLALPSTSNCIGPFRICPPKLPPERHSSFLLSCSRKFSCTCSSSRKSRLQDGVKALELRRMNGNHTRSMLSFDFHHFSELQQSTDTSDLLQFTDDETISLARQGRVPIMVVFAVIDLRIFAHRDLKALQLETGRE